MSNMAVAVADSLYITMAACHCSLSTNNVASWCSISGISGSKLRIPCVSSVRPGICQSSAGGHGSRGGGGVESIIAMTATIPQKFRCAGFRMTV